MCYKEKISVDEYEILSIADKDMQHILFKFLDRLNKIESVISVASQKLGEY